MDILWLCVMVYLSHAGGGHTARQSRELHRITRINEHKLRGYGSFILLCCFRSTMEFDGRKKLMDYDAYSRINF